jgi:hypothetical protein
MQKLMAMIRKEDQFKAMIVGVALFLSLVVFMFRLVTEQRNLDVELAFDYQDVLMLQAYTGHAQEDIYRMLQKAGVSSICVPEDTLQNLSERGKATWISGKDLLNMSRLGQIQSYILTNLIRSADIVPENYYVMIDQAQTYSRAKNALINELGSDRAREVGTNILEIKGQVSNLAQIGLDVDPILVQDLSWYKFQMIPRIMNSKRLDDVSLGLKVDKIKALGKINTVIFNGTEVLGYGTNMNLVAEKMVTDNLNFGYVEFAQQKGEVNLAELLPGQTIGVHSVPAKDMQTMNMDRAIDRYLLAAMERGIRILYVRPFVNDEIKGDLLTYNEQFITTLKQRLEHRGFHIQPIEKMHSGLPMVVSIVFGVFISLSVGVALYYFFLLFFPKLPENIMYGTMTLIFILDLIFLQFNYFSQWRSLLALIIAVIFPTYAMITQLPKENTWHTKEHDLKEIVKIIGRVIAITAVGILLIIGLLSDVYYMLKVYQFRGVKLAFGLPLLIVAFYYFLYPYRVNALKFLVKRFSQSQVTIGYVVGALAVAAFLGLYLLRSGNYQLPVMEAEQGFRKLLGYLMFVRPRTKEFLIGWPILIFTLFNLGKFISYKHKWLFYTIATVAPISLLNTFCHLHAPLWISVLRSVNGLVLGVGIGYASVYLYRASVRIWKFIF